MKRITATLLAALALVCCASIRDAKAFGLGLYGEYGTGSSGTLTLDDGSWGSEEYDVDSSHAGGGFVMDTAIARPSVFNYRLKLGYERPKFENTDLKLELDGKAYLMDHTFGFAVLRQPVVRLWLGPQLRIAYFDGTLGEHTDATAVGAGIGLVVGANFHLGPVVSLGVETGYRYMAYSGWYGVDDDDLTITDGQAFVGAVLLFRTGDRY